MKSAITLTDLKGTCITFFLLFVYTCFWCQKLKIGYFSKLNALCANGMQFFCAWRLNCIFLRFSVFCLFEKTFS